VIHISCCKHRPLSHFLLSNLLFHSTGLRNEQSASLEAVGRSGNEEVSCPLWNKNIHHWLHWNLYRTILFHSTRYHPISAIPILILYSHLSLDIQSCSCTLLISSIHATHSSHLNLLHYPPDITCCNIQLQISSLCNLTLVLRKSPISSSVRLKTPWNLPYRFYSSTE